MATILASAGKELEGKMTDLHRIMMNRGCVACETNAEELKVVAAKCL